MASIEKVREHFIGQPGDEKKVLAILSALFERIGKEEHGAVVGEVRDVDYVQVLEQAVFPNEMSCEAEVIERVGEMYDGVLRWEEPHVQLNVVPPPTALAIAGAALTARYNENAASDLYGPSAARAEVMAVGMLADLIGLDKRQVGGLFTFGGTGCNLYGARIGIEKADPGVKQRGIQNRIHIYCSDVAHYSVKSAAIWTGIGLENLIVIPSNPDNEMDVVQLEAAMERSLQTNARIGPIFATMGTTDAFGIDPLRDIVELRDRFAQRVNYGIHVHADAVIGWPFLVFRGDELLDGLSPQLALEIEGIVAKMADLHLADSIGIDFHKTGWTPYLCSAFLAVNRQDLMLLERQQADMPYLYHSGSYHPGRYTLESSRPNYAQKAVMNMLLLGREGYRTLITHLLGVADHLRDHIVESHDIALLNRHNPAFVTDFRVYPHTKYASDGRPLAEKELADDVAPEFTLWVNEYNRRIVEQMQAQVEKEGAALLSYSDSYRTTQQRALVAVKSYPMSPFIETVHMDDVLAALYRAKDAVDRDLMPSEFAEHSRV